MKQAIIIVIGPSGSGKSSFVDKVITELAELEDLKTYTTRLKREGDVDGDPYHFISLEDFEDRIKKDFFVEWAQVHGRYYGSSNEQFIASWQREKAIIMDVDVQGARTIKSKYPQAYTIFIKPPSMKELRVRLAKRDGENSADLDLRLKNAEKEMIVADEFDAQLINDDFDRSYGEFKKMIEDYLNAK